MKIITILTDYKNHFESKYKAFPYKSGLDKNIIKQIFNKYGYDVEYLNFSCVDLRNNWKNKIVLYTSSEDVGYHYKSFIEDVVYGLELVGAIVIPKYKFLKANNNKVFMEFIRTEIFGEDLLQSKCFGTIEELKKSLSNTEIKFPCVIKNAAGAMSRGVDCAKSEKELILKVGKFSKTTSSWLRLKEFVRVKKYKGYIPESQNRNKFIVQPMVEGLTNDWKILIYGNHIYNLKRNTRKNDFRASGSGVNYIAGSKSGLTSEMLTFLWDAYKKMDLPFVSIDYANDGKNNYIIEFQAIYFGTATQVFCNDYFILEDGIWKIKEKEYSIEDAYAFGIIDYLKRHNLV